MRDLRKMEYGLRQEDGVVGVVIVLLLASFVALTALAVDIAHLYVVRNELHNAADAGALAGARQLLNSDGATINAGANHLAFVAATDNNSERVAVEVKSPETNQNDVQRGHWSFTTHTFTKNANLTQLVGWQTMSTAALDTDPNFINAVKVVSRRQDIQAKSFFAGILGHFGFSVAAEAVAYIGFSGGLLPMEVDEPIAICRQSITDEDGNYTNCNIGRMLNSGSNAATHNTAAWTNFTLDCATANPPSVNPYICGTGNPILIPFESTIGSTGGTVNTLIQHLQNCFGTRTTPWNMTLPVIDCPGNNPGNCSKVIGAVNINIVWIAVQGLFKQDGFPPSAMGGWTPTAGFSEQQNWDSFASYFKLENVDGLPATYQHDSIYFLPSCSPTDATGVTGGANYGIQAKIPVLVQ
jgi:Flp pilus assembly protein TadG